MSARIPSSYWATRGGKRRWFTYQWRLNDDSRMYNVYGVGARGEPVGPLYVVRIKTKPHPLERIGV